jgi:phosphoesterase RecJ-like protein
MTREAWQLIEGAQKILLIAHVDPDGDTIGSSLALGHALRRMGKDGDLACSDPAPKALSFLPGIEEFATPAVSDHDLVITVDVSDLRRLGASYEHVPATDIPVLNIDHHATNTEFATVNLVRPKASATAEIVFDLLTEWAVEIDELLATYLLTGIVTDTRSFSTPNTTPRALEISSELVRAGASLIEINENYYRQKDLGTLRMWGRMLEQMRLDDNVLWSTETSEMKKEFHPRSDSGDGIVNLLATAEQAAAAIVFRERADGRIEISIRSRPEYDISPIAVHFGGGGHPQAAGATINGSMETAIPMVLAKAREVLDSKA